MRRQPRLGPRLPSFAHHARPFLRGAMSSLPASREKPKGRLSSILECPRRFLYRASPFWSFQYVRNLISWNYRQDRPCSSSRAMDPGPTAVPTNGIENKVDADCARWLKKGECFQLTENCKLVLLRGDITKWHIDRQTDAIVNAANSRMLGGGGVDGAIHDEAGPELKQACRQVPEVTRGVRCPTGEARLTRGFKLPVSRIIHTVGPIYYGNSRAEELLRKAYKNSFAVAVQDGVQYIAFPAISCGVYGYPLDEAASIALRTVKECCAGLQEVHFVLFDQKAFYTWMEEAENSLEKVAVTQSPKETENSPEKVRVTQRPKEKSENRSSNQESHHNTPKE